MIRVANGKCIRNLSKKSMLAARTRNLIAICAIALTTLLFTSLFTIAMSVNESFQQANFRQAGGYAHGSFKNLTKEQADELKTDPLIKEYGLRQFVGMPEDVPFQKTHVEVSYGDANWAKFSYCELKEGSFPKEGTKEAATDTSVLALLGIEPKIGEAFSLTFDVDGQETTQEFILSGWWEFDDAQIASYVQIPESRAQEIFTELNTQANDGMTSYWILNVMFANASHIEENIQKILADHGYQNAEPAEPNYIGTGVNWGYTGAQLTANVDGMTMAAIAVVLLLIIFTGYLIIYNVFQISVAGDIRFYGLLKTIGTTPRQIRRILRNQALLLSAAGIPIGLLLGWFVGAKLTPVILSQLNHVVVDTVSIDPWIFALAAVFSLVTVLLSCFRPGRIAGKVSPVEAIRYTEGNRKQRKKEKRGNRKVSLPKMAFANLGRSRGKTAVTVLSLALAVVLLNLTVVFVDGFDMDKYLRDRVADFVVASADYFQSDYMDEENALSEAVIEDVENEGGIKAGGRVYAPSLSAGVYVNNLVTEDVMRAKLGRYISDSAQLAESMKRFERTEEGLYADIADLYGMEAYGLDKVTVIDGDIDSIREPGTNHIAAVYDTGDYGEVVENSNWAKVGDTITLRYVEEYELVGSDTGEVYEDQLDSEDASYVMRPKVYRDVKYQVTATVTVPSALSFRYYGNARFLLNDQDYIQDTGNQDVMLYACDMENEESTAHMEQFLSNYTSGRDSLVDYESKLTYEKEFHGFQNMFLMLGGALSFIVGIVGILNFFNAILTGILTRKREFAMLQSIGMTGKQLKQMLIWEGLYYVIGAIGFSLILTVIMGPVLASALESAFWFFSYHLSVTAILILTPIFAVLGCTIPATVYRRIARTTIVERLREME